MANKHMKYAQSVSHSVVSDPVIPWTVHARLPCPSPTPGACSNSCASSRWCHPTISSSVTPFSSHRQSFPASGSFPLSQFFASGGQSIGVSVSTSVLPMNIQDWLVWFPCSPRDSQESSPTPRFNSINFLALSFLYSPTLTSTCDYWKNHGFDYTDVYCLYLEMVGLFIEDHKESKTNKNKTFLELSSASSQDKKSTDKS